MFASSRSGDLTVRPGPAPRRTRDGDMEIVHSSTTSAQLP